MQENNSQEIAKTLVKSIFGAIPFVGTLMNEVVYEHRSRIKQERLNNFIEILIHYFESNPDIARSIRLDKINIEEFSDLFEAILFSVSKNSSIDKLNIFRNILVKRLESKNVGKDLEKIYIDITNSISEVQFVILNHYSSLSEDELGIPVKLELDRLGLRKFINVPGFTRQDWVKERGLLYKKWKSMRDPNDCKTYQMGRENFIINVTDLISKGMLFDYNAENEALERSKFIGITLSGRKYIEYVKEGTTDSNM